MRGLPLQPHHLHEQTGDDNKEFVKNYDENNVHFNDAMRKNRWKSKFQIPPVPHPVVRLLRKQENGWSQTRPGPNQMMSISIHIEATFDKKWVSRVVSKISKLSSDLVELSFMMIM